MVPVFQIENPPIIKLTVDPPIVKTSKCEL